MRDFEAGLTLERLKEALHYSPETGIFTWLIRTAHRNQIGDVAGCIKKSGYVFITLDNQRYRAHRLAWFYMTGRWPSGQIDHKDTVRRHNWWTNLRPATNQQNQMNAIRPKNNTSGHKGVYWCKRKEKWVARIFINGKNIYLGYFTDPTLAGQAYLKASQLHFGEFARAA